MTDDAAAHQGYVRRWQVKTDQLPTEYVRGQWRMAGEEEPQAFVVYAAEPSPETGHVGWCWWALGTMGDSESYEAACRAAEAELRRKGVVTP